MENMKNMKKMWLNSLGFLDNCYVNAVIVIILALYCSTIFDNINSFIGNLYNFSVIKLAVLVLIIYVAPKDVTIAILLAVSYLVSLNYLVNTENFSPLGISEESMNYSSHMNNTASNSPLMLSTASHSPPPSNLKLVQSEHAEHESFTSKKKQKEHFFPLMEVENPSENNFDSREKKHSNLESKSSCESLYVPHYESVGDVCSPTATFKNELNAQGLNDISGFNHQVFGSPL